MPRFPTGSGPDDDEDKVAPPNDQSLGDKVSNFVSDSASKIQDYIAQQKQQAKDTQQKHDIAMADRLRMGVNPDIQGPPQPGLFDKPLPYEDDYMNNILGMASAGSIQSGNGYKTVRKVAENLENMPSIQYSQEKIAALRQMLGNIMDRDSIDPATKYKMAQKLKTYITNAGKRGITEK